MKLNFVIVSVFSVGLFLVLSGCQAQDPVEPESRQAEQNTKVSINVVGEEDTPAESGAANVTLSTTEGTTTTVAVTPSEEVETD